MKPDRQRAKIQIDDNDKKSRQKKKQDITPLPRQCCVLTRTLTNFRHSFTTRTHRLPSLSECKIFQDKKQTQSLEARYIKRPQLFIVQFTCLHCCMQRTNLPTDLFTLAEGPKMLLSASRSLVSRNFTQQNRALAIKTAAAVNPKKAFLLRLEEEKAKAFIGGGEARIAKQVFRLCFVFCCCWWWWCGGGSLRVSLWKKPTTIAFNIFSQKHAKGRLTARERVDCFLDDGSFREYDMLKAHRCTEFGMEKQEYPGMP
jgi:hypothetical protein